MTSSSTTPEITNRDGVTVIGLGIEYENLDEHLLDRLREVMLEVAKTADPALLVLDLSNTKFFGSAFIEILFGLASCLQSRGGQFALCGLTPYCREVLTITHLDSLWPIFANREEAVSALRKQAAES